MIGLLGDADRVPDDSRPSPSWWFRPRCSPPSSATAGSASPTTSRRRSSAAWRPLRQRRSSRPRAIACSHHLLDVDRFRPRNAVDLGVPFEGVLRQGKEGVRASEEGRGRRPSRAPSRVGWRVGKKGAWADVGRSRSHGEKRRPPFAWASAMMANVLLGIAAARRSEPGVDGRRDRR